MGGVLSLDIGGKDFPGAAILSWPGDYHGPSAKIALAPPGGDDGTEGSQARRGGVQAGAGGERRSKPGRCIAVTADQVKAVIASYWRYVRQCPVIALEVSHNLSAYADEERADVLAVDKNRFLIETEVKVTLADLRRDARKSKHRDFQDKRFCVARYFYFAVPRDIANDAKLTCDNLYSYAGVLGVDGTDEYGVEIYRNAKPLSDKKLTYPQVLRIIFNQSSTVCRLAKKVEEMARVRQNLEAQLKEYRDREKLWQR
jgi:hypothetical protein